jgi:hypothetical protein
MMARLILYVANHRCAVRFAYAEGPLPALPREGVPFRPTLLHPAGGVRFHHAHAISQRQIGRHPREYVDMIRRSPDGNGCGFQFSQDSTNVGVCVGPDIVRKKRHAASGRKHNMREQVCERVPHSFAPPGLPCQSLRDTPGLRLGLPSYARYAGSNCLHHVGRPRLAPAAIVSCPLRGLSLVSIPRPRLVPTAIVLRALPKPAARTIRIAQPGPQPRRQPKPAPAPAASAPVHASSSSGTGRRCGPPPPRDSKCLR